MRCKKCGEENGWAKRCCSRCWSILEGKTINNVTGQPGYRNSDGSFTPDGGSDKPKLALREEFERSGK